MKLCEVLDDYDKALRKMLLLLSQVFPYQFQRIHLHDYEAVRPDGKLKIIAALSGINVRVDHSEAL